jgi:hypothetical protein
MEINQRAPVLGRHGTDRGHLEYAEERGNQPQGPRPACVHGWGGSEPGAGRATLSAGEVGLESDDDSQADPGFESERVYCKLSAAHVVELLIEKKGYTNLELPSNETIRNILNAEGYTLRKVQKTKPKKRSLRPTPSSSRFIE